MRDDDVAAAFDIAGDLVHEMPETVDALKRYRQDEARRKAIAAARKHYSDGGLAEQLGGYAPKGIDMETGEPIKKPDGE